MREQLLSNENPSEAQAGKAIAGADTPSPPATFFWIVAATLTLIVAIPIWLCDYFPSHNGPSLLLISYIEYAFGVPELGFADYFECHPFPIPYLLNSIVVQTLFAFFDPVTADKLWVTVLVCTRPWAVIYFLRQLQPGREFLGLISYLFVYDFSMMRGYYNYFAGVSLAFVLLGYYIRHRSHWNAWSTAALNALVLLQYFIHPFALVVSGLMLAAYEISVSRSPARPNG